MTDRRRLPGDVAELWSKAYEHKIKVGYHRRRLRETMAKLRSRCDQLGIPVPPLPNTEGSQSPQGGAE
jgi:hypothetical protein